MTRRARLIVVAAVAIGGCGGGGATAPKDAAAPADAAAEGLTDAAADLFVDVPRDVAPPRDTDGDTATDAPPSDFIAIAPCPAPESYATAAQVNTSGDNRYNPACVRVAAGGTVTIEASAPHPLEPRAGGSPGNPIPARNETATVRFPTPGFYPFLCPEHADQGMTGVVWVTGPSP